jgi:hypothetical protein
MNNLFFILPFLFPTYLVKFNLPIGGSINLLDILLLSLIIFLAFNALIKKYQSFLNHIQGNKLFLLLLALFIFGLLLSYILNLNQTNWLNGMGIIKSFYFLPIAFALLVDFFEYDLFQQTLKVCKNRPSRSVSSFFLWFLTGYFSYSSLLALIGIIYLLSHNLTYDNRLAIFFDSPNQLAMALAPSIIIGLSFIQNKSRASRNLRILIALLSLVQFFILLKTQSLGAVVGLVFAAAFLIFKRKQKAIFSFAMALSLLSIFLIFNASFFLNLAHYQPNIPATAIDSRLAIYQASEKMIKNDFFFGIGPGNFQKAYLDNQKYFSPYPQWAVPHAHNLLTNFWLETGLLGLLSFLAILCLVYKKTSPKEDETRIYVITCVGILIYLLVHGLFDTTYWKNDLAIIFWLTIAKSLKN